MDSFTLGPTRKIDFTRTVEHTLAMTWELANLRFSLNTLSKLEEFNTKFCTKHKPRALKLASSGRFSAISFQKQRNSIFIRFTSRRLDRASGRSWLKSFPRSNETLEYSEIMGIVRTCCHVIRTACRDFPNSVDFWNPTPCWILIDLGSRRCCFVFWMSSSLSAGHWSAGHWGAPGRLQRPVRTVAQEPAVFGLNFARTLHGHL
jgi:hypothetical protein